MQPIGNVWSRFPRLVRDVARASGKHVRLQMEGQKTELDKTLIEAIGDPLTHLVRNAIDHGIEGAWAWGPMRCPPGRARARARTRTATRPHFGTGRRTVRVVPRAVGPAADEDALEHLLGVDVGEALRGLARGQLEAPGRGSHDS